MPKIFWWGALLLLLGTGPLLALFVATELGLTSDPNPNPIGLGLLSFVSFWPAVTMMIIGLFRRRKR